MTEETPRSDGRLRGEAGESAAEALARARLHARRALGEALAAVHALVDAAALGWSGRPSQAHAGLRGFADLLDEQSRHFLEGEGVVPSAVVQAILDALDQEIARWEQRAERDAEARAVLRTFLGLREILWEFGFRRPDPSASPDRPEAKSRPSERRRRSPAATAAPKRPGRVQRVDVQG